MTQSHPTTADQWNALAATLEQQGRFGDLVNACLQSLRLDERQPETLFRLGNALLNTGNVLDAIGAYQRALALRPEFPEALNNLGFTLRLNGRHIEAIEVLGKALQLRPNYPDALNNLGMCLGEGGMLDEAVEALRKALSLKPNFAQALGNLGNSYLLLGQLDEAIRCFRRSWELEPGSSSPDNLLFDIHFHPKYGPKRIWEEHVRWNRKIAARLKPQQLKFENDASPDRGSTGSPQGRLKIGYVSADFRDHSQAMFTVPLLSHHDHERFEIVCYSDVRAPDALTSRIRGYADVWRETAGLSDAQLTELVHRDRIDIFVDLALHMAGNRLLVFARKPAPVQVTWLGYPSTTGLDTMDYRLSDPYLDPPDQTDQYFFENTIRLPHSFWCYDPLNTDLEISPLPAKANGFITFGCLNNFAKVTGPTFELWAKVMQKVPRSQLILLAPRGSARSRVHATMSALGIDRSRIDFCDRLAREQYLANYRQFDMCLDTIPYPGHTTTFDSLWMGVPLVTLPGATSVSRGGLSILSNVGLGELIATEAEQYVRIVTGLANDLPKLAELRATLRERMAASAVMNAVQFASDIECAYGQMWRQWCQSRQAK